jgi:hypothetical protein
MWRVLQRHPEVAFSPAKELHYFSTKHAVEKAPEHLEHIRRLVRERVDRYRPTSAARPRIRLRMLAHWLSMHDDDDYKDYFDRVAECSGKPCVGEITPLYSMLPAEGFRDIVAVMPDVRLFFLMRNPVERIWSNARMGGKVPSDLFEFSERRGVRGRTDYKTSLERLCSAVPREQVHVAFYEELCDPVVGAKHRNELFAHLGISPFDVPSKILDQREGGGPAAKLDPVVRRELVRRTRPIYEFARDFMGHIPANWERDLTEV